MHHFKKPFFVSFLISILFVSSCKREQVDSQQTNQAELPTKKETVQRIIKDEPKKRKQLINFSNGESFDEIKLEEKTVLIIALDSLELEQLKKIHGEDNFYTGADDLMWYNAQLLQKIDSLNIPLKITTKDTVDVRFNKTHQTIKKDSTFTIYNYFYFNGNQLKKTDVWELTRSDLLSN